MKLAGVIGDPIKHSRSPQLHGYWLQHYGVDGAYVPLRVSADDLQNVLKTLPKMGFSGVNVTIPHKEAALVVADQVTETAQNIGAANTLYFRNGKIIADNTDAYGFLANLDQMARDWPSDRPALVFGAGGAARAVLFGLISRGCPAIYLVNRSRDKAEKLAEYFRPQIQVIDSQEVQKILPDIGLLANTTSLGMDGQPALDVDLSSAAKSSVITDIVYTPLKTPLLAQAEMLGLKAVDGLGMLLHQAVPGFEAWFGRRPEVTDELREAVLK